MTQTISEKEHIEAVAVVDKEQARALRRVAVAKDVIAQLLARKIVAAQGHYVSPHLFMDKCQACALGAIFVSYTGIRSTRVDNAMDIHNMLGTCFDDEQLCLIESAFEKWKACPFGLVIGDDKAAAFGRRFRSSRARMVAIMQNIIANNGTFVPEAA